MFRGRYGTQDSSSPTKTQIELARLRRPSGASKYKPAEASSLLLQPIKQAASPDEVGSKQAQAKRNDEPAWARCHKEHDAEREKGESRENAKRASRLLKRLENE